MNLRLRTPHFSWPGNGSYVNLDVSSLQSLAHRQPIGACLFELDFYEDDPSRSIFSRDFYLQYQTRPTPTSSHGRSVVSHPCLTQRADGVKVTANKPGGAMY